MHANARDRHRLGSDAQRRDRVAAAESVVLIAIRGERMNGDQRVAAVRPRHVRAERQPFAVQRRHGPAAHDASGWSTGTPTVCDRYPITCRSYGPSRVHVARDVICSISPACSRPSESRMMRPTSVSTRLVYAAQLARRMPIRIGRAPRPSRAARAKRTSNPRSPLRSGRGARSARAFAGTVGAYGERPARVSAISVALAPFVERTIEAALERPPARGRARSARSRHPRATYRPGSSSCARHVRRSRLRASRISASSSDTRRCAVSHGDPAPSASRRRADRSSSVRRTRRTRSSSCGDERRRASALGRHDFPFGEAAVERR